MAFLLVYGDDPTISSEEYHLCPIAGQDWSKKVFQTKKSMIYDRSAARLSKHCANQSSFHQEVIFLFFATARVVFHPLVDNKFSNY